MKPSILVVDDNADLRDIIASDFQKHGYRVQVASGGHEALEQVRRSEIDLVLTDTHMPEGDGIWLLDQVKELRPETKVAIFITGFEGFSAEDAYALGADVVLSKPFHRKELFSVVDRALLSLEQRWSLRPERFENHLEIDLDLECGVFSAEGRLVNIGNGGMFVAMDSLLPLLGTQLKFKFHVKGNPELEMEGLGVIRWIRQFAEQGKPAGCGVEFQYFEQRSRTLILDLVKKAGARAFIPAT